MPIINETKKYLHMLVKMLIFILVLCGLKLIESFFDLKRMPEAYSVSYLIFAYFILGRLFTLRKEKIMMMFYIVLDFWAMSYLIKKDVRFLTIYLAVFIFLSLLMVLVYTYFNKKEEKIERTRFLIFLIPCYLLFIKIIFLIIYIYLHIDEYNVLSLWFL